MIRRSLIVQMQSIQSRDVASVFILGKDFEDYYLTISQRELLCVSYICSQCLTMKYFICLFGDEVRLYLFGLCVQPADADG